MKARIILWGWAISWLLLFAGIGTMEQGDLLLGAFLCSVWFLYSGLLIANEAACRRELANIEKWMERMFGGSGKDKDKGDGGIITI